MIVLFWAIFFAVTITTHYLYNVRMIEIKPFSYFDTFPFRCYKCCTTWALIVVYMGAGILLADLAFTLLGITLASLYGYGLNKTEKERFQ